MKFRRTIKGDLSFLITLFVILFLLPHIAMSIPGFPHHPIEAWYQETVGEGRDMVFGWVALWSAVPFFSLAAALFRVLYDRPFSLLLPVEVLVISLTYLPRWPVLAPALALLALPLLAMEGFNALRDRGAEKGGKLLAGAAANRKFLAVVFAWSAGYMCALCAAACFRAVFELPLAFFALLPTALVLPFLPLTALEDPPLTGGGLAGVGLMWALSALLAATPLMSPFAAIGFFLPWHLGLLSFGFAALLLMEGLIRLVRRVKARGRPSGS